MLWYDNNPKSTVEQKVLRAAEYFEKKYNKYPTTCIVNTGVFDSIKKHEEDTPEVNGIKLIGSKLVLKNYLQIG